MGLKQDFNGASILNKLVAATSEAQLESSQNQKISDHADQLEAQRIGVEPVLANELTR